MAATRILTTHTGSLPRPPEIGEHDLLEGRIYEAVGDVVRKQIECGIDIVNDGEVGKFSYSGYVKERLSGFSQRGVPRQMKPADTADFPGYAARLEPQLSGIFMPVCEGPITYIGLAVVERDCENLRRALKWHDFEGAFLSAASPGVIARFIENRYYPSHESHLTALAEAMKTEYDAIHRAGFLLQVDCPELTGNRDIPGVAPGTDLLGLHSAMVEGARIASQRLWE
jgi:5-methyltetrahydropteroyltriglutamate--homocysteine methyltransferase